MEREVLEKVKKSVFSSLGSYMEEECNLKVAGGNVGYELSAILERNLRKSGVGAEVYFVGVGIGIVDQSYEVKTKYIIEYDGGKEIEVDLSFLADIDVDMESGEIRIFMTPYNVEVKHKNEEG